MTEMPDIPNPLSIATSAELIEELHRRTDDSMIVLREVHDEGGPACQVGLFARTQMQLVRMTCGLVECLREHLTDFVDDLEDKHRDYLGGLYGDSEF